MAGRIPEQFIDEVRNSVDIVDVISQYVSLEKKGKDYLGLRSEERRVGKECGS